MDNHAQLFKAVKNRTYWTRSKNLLISNLPLFNLRDIIVPQCSFQEPSFQIQNPCITNLENVGKHQAESDFCPTMQTYFTFRQIKNSKPCTASLELLVDCS